MADVLHYLRKLLNRYPAIPFGWEMHDWLAAAMVTIRHGESLVARYREARGPEQLYDFAAGPPELFPSHQIKSEICGFLAYAAERKPKVAVEIGTARSGTNFLIGECLLAVELIIGIDLQPRNLKLLRLFTREGLKRIMIRGESTSERTLVRVREALAGRAIDLLFIDGDHAYDGVRGDFETYWPLVASGGLVAFHDIVPDYRTRRGEPTGRWAGDVPKYWREVSVGREGIREFVEDPEQDGLGIGVFTK